MKKIPLTKGHTAFVDDLDYDRLSQFNWQSHKGYAVRTKYFNGGQTKIFMHHEVVGYTSEIDHEDGNKANNQRYNLRPATRSQNMAARQAKRIGTSSRFRGVTWDKDCLTWRAQLGFQGRKIHLGCFKVEADAARAYDTAARKYFKEFSTPNFTI